jgi:hypothetical protein
LFVVGPVVYPGFLIAMYALKLAVDRVAGFPPWVTLCTPISLLLSIPLQMDSAVRHWTRTVVWKSRRVAGLTE